MNRATESLRIGREKRTIAAMVALYCADLHGARGNPCDVCLELRRYAFDRLDRCPFGPRKTTCARCAIHCYKPAMRAQVRAVMRYAGGRACCSGTRSWPSCTNGMTCAVGTGRSPSEEGLRTE